jgi:hypothetical protein
MCLYNVTHAFGFDSLRSKWNAPIFLLFGVPVGFSQDVSLILCRRRTSRPRTFICVAIHPYEETVAVGDVTGRIVLFPDIFRSNGLKTEYHWHNNPLRCLSFSSEGIVVIRSFVVPV